MVAIGISRSQSQPLKWLSVDQGGATQVTCVARGPEQVSRLLAEPKSDTVIGLRDRALLALLYGTRRPGLGVRQRYAVARVDLTRLTITVQGKGGHERTIPLNPQLAEVLHTYVHARGARTAQCTVLLGPRFGRPLFSGCCLRASTNLGAAQSRRHPAFFPTACVTTFATHLVRAPAFGLVTIRDLLGPSTNHQYADLFACDGGGSSILLLHVIRSARCFSTVEHLLPCRPIAIPKTKSLRWQRIDRLILKRRSSIVASSSSQVRR